MECFVVERWLALIIITIVSLILKSMTLHTCGSVSDGGGGGGGKVKGKKEREKTEKKRGRNRGEKHKQT